MEGVFRVGGRYRNRNGAYEVLALEGEKMRVRFKDGREQLLTISQQERIWDNIQAESQPQAPQASDSVDDEGPDTYPVMELVHEVLRARFKRPFPSDIIDQVCLAIEQNPAWLGRYHVLFSTPAARGRTAG